MTQSKDRLSNSQIEMLKKAGFVYQNCGWCYKEMDKCIYISFDFLNGICLSLTEPNYFKTQLIPIVFNSVEDLNNIKKATSFLRNNTHGSDD